ncbi:MAG: hypothetical protein LBL54_02965 [Clostridiales Family XIII bacterium]|nr:hypothetical protein [Clostridiales Family XIII bacterium]
MRKQVSLFAGGSELRSRFTASLCAVVMIALLWGVAPLESHAESEVRVYEKFTYTIIGGKIHIWGYDGNNRINNKEVVVVPGEIEKKPVVAVELINIGGKSISFRKCTQLKSLYAEALFFDRIDLAKTAKLQSLKLHESGDVTVLSLGACKQLKDLYLDVKTLQKLSVSSCTKLQSLIVENAKLKSLDLGKCVALREFEAEGGELTSVTLGKKRSLKTVNVSQNKLKTLDVSGCAAMTELDFSYNKGLAVNISKNRKLKTLTYSPWGNNYGTTTITNPVKNFPFISRYKNM